MISASVTAGNTNEPIAIVGIGCRLPGSITDPASFWAFLNRKGNAIAQVPPGRWNADKFYTPEGGMPGSSQSKWGGFVDDIYGFDPAFFDISPREVDNMDPQQSGLLQVVYEALQDANITMARASRSSTGVFVGITTSDFRTLLEQDTAIPRSDLYAGTGVALCIAANRISHRFDLHGPSLAVDTACSSSMVAVDLACRAIHDGTCAMAVAAGVNVLASPRAFSLFSNSNMLSPTGRLSTFDASADGYVRGEGFGAVVLKPLSQALKDGDDIYGLIRATAVNQDGHTQTLTAPSQEAQISMLEGLCAKAGVDPGHVGFVECHGTGTPTGDPIEAGAVGCVFGKDRRLQPLLIGSVKPNLGHLEPAAGITGLIKGALVARHGAIPPNINFDTPNPNIPFAALNLEVARETCPLPNLGGRQLVVVNSFGFGGTNASALIEAWRPDTQRPCTQQPGKPQVVLPASFKHPGNNHRAAIPRAVPISAATEASLQQLARAYADQLGAGGALAVSDPADLARTIDASRDHLNHRVAVIGANASELSQELAAFARGEVSERVLAGRAAEGHKICFTFSGQGSQWYAMGRGLYENEPAYRQSLERFDEIFIRHSGWSVIETLLADEASSRVNEPTVTQCTICALQIALAALWKHYGVEPDMIVGHSLGEVAAAHVAGAMDLETAVFFVHSRSQVASQVSRNGAMAVVGLSADELEQMLPADGSVAIAVYNAPAMMTLSGDAAAVKRFTAALKADRPDVFVRAMGTDTAWHSRHLDPCESWFRSWGDVACAEPSIPFISTVTGAPACRLDLDYWWLNLRNPVRYQQAVETAVALGATIFLELSPHRTLTGPTGQCAAGAGANVGLVTTLDRKLGDRLAFAKAIGELYVRGVDIDWSAAAPGEAGKMHLPKYPWSKVRYAAYPDEVRSYLFDSAVHPLLGRRLGGPIVTWRSLVNLRSFRFIADHRMRQESLFPGAGYVEIMLAAGLDLYGKGAIEIEDMKIHDALFIRQDATIALQTTYQAERDTVRIFSRGQDDGAEWVLRAEGRVRQRDTEIAPRSFGPVDNPIGALRPFWYDAKGPQALIEFGPLFHSVKKFDVASGGDRSVANVVAHPAIADEASKYNAHPALLDAALQMTDPNIATLGTPRSAFDEQGRFNGATHFIPTGIRRVVLLAPLVAEMTLEVGHKVRDGRPCGNSGIFRDANGRALVVVEDVLTKAIPVTASSESKPGVVEPEVVEETYQPIALPAAEGASASGRVLVLADVGAPIEPLLTALSAGANVAIVRPDEAASNDLVGYQVLFEQALDQGEPVSSVIFAASLSAAELSDNCETKELVEAAERNILALTALGQVLERRNAASPAPSVIVLTHMARHLPGDAVASVDGLVQSPLVGLARTIATECSSYPFLQIDLDDHALTDPDALLRAMSACRVETEIVLRDARALAPRLERRALADIPACTKRVIQSDRQTNFVATMKSPGVIDTLELRETAMPEIGPEEVLLEVGAVGLNFRDVMAVTGLLPVEAEPEPAWLNLGMEYGATVAAVGTLVTTLAPGDRVMGTGRRCLQRFIAAPAATLTKLGEQLSLAGAATIPSVFATAHYALNHVARMRKGERVLIHVATGGVGLAAVQLAKRAGAEIFATAGNAEKRAYLTSLGIEHVMNSRNLDFADEIMRITNGKGVDIILNSLPAAYISKGMDILAPYGRFLEIGKRDVYADTAVGLKALRKNIQLAVLDLASVGMEKPELMKELLAEVNAMLEAGEIAPLPVTSFPVPRVADAFRYMSQAKHIGKVVVTFDQPSADVRGSMERPFRLDGAGSYLVTGGSRGFGLAVADWMSRCGAGSIVLSSRSGKVDPEESNRLAAISARGTKVTSIALDVTDAEAVAEVVGRLAREPLPLRGIVHGAAVIEDALLSQLDDDLVRRVVRPKLAGAWNLHRALDQHAVEVDFLLSFSSTSQLFGALGQSNYVAGNAFLDAFAQYRRKNGKAAFTADWGPLGGSGVVSRNEQLAGYVQSMGLHLVADHDATAALETFLRADRASLAYTAMDWAKFRRTNPTLAQNPRVAPLLAESGTKLARVRSDLAMTPRTEWPARIAAFLQGAVAKVLKADPQNVPVDRSLSEVGLDSLSSFELKFSVEEELALEIPVSKFLQATTIETLSAAVIEVIDAQADAVAATAEQSSKSGSQTSADNGGEYVASDRQIGLMAIEFGHLTSAAARKSLRLKSRRQ